MTLANPSLLLAVLISSVPAWAAQDDDTPARQPRGWRGLWKVTAHEVTDPRNRVHPEETFHGIVAVRGSVAQVYGRLSTWAIPVESFILSGDTLTAEVASNWTNPEIPQKVKDELNSRKLPHRVELNLAGDGMTATGVDSGPWARWSREREEVTETYHFDRPLTLERIGTITRFVRVSSDGVSRPIVRIGEDDPFHLELITREEVSMPSERPFGTNIPLALVVEGGSGAFNMFRPAGARTAEAGGGFIHRSPPIRLRQGPAGATARFTSADGAVVITLAPGSRLLGAYGPPIIERTDRFPRMLAPDDHVAVTFDPRPPVRFYAVSATGLRPVERIALGLPMVVEVLFDRPIPEAACEVICKAGAETLRLVAHRTKEDPLLYRTGAFLVRAGSTEGLDPPLPGELRVTRPGTDDGDEQPDD